MVELCDVKLLSPNTTEDSNNCAHWPQNIDERVANLDFGNSMMEGGGQSALFAASLIGADPALVSTDSLDIEMLRMRCEGNKYNDYKLTFEEDSGQWTTSGIGASFMSNETASPPAALQTKVLKLLRNGQDNCAKFSTQNLDSRHNHPSLRLLEHLNSADDEGGGVAKKKILASQRELLLDEIFNNSTYDCDVAASLSKIDLQQQPVTWGRLGSGTGLNGDKTIQPPPFNSDKVNSLPTLSVTRASNLHRIYMPVFSKGESSPSFANGLPKSHADYDVAEEEYAELYIGNGRYIDMNQNEIGYVPPSTAPIQRRQWGQSKNTPGQKNQQNLPSKKSVTKKEGDKTNSAAPTISSNRQSASLATSIGPFQSRKSVPRTFADLSPSKTAPDLKFIALSHKIPSICTFPSMTTSCSSGDLLRRAKSGNIGAILEYPPEKQLFMESEGFHTESNEDEPDSGLGSSHSEGPSHIEDWHSLSVLLPRHVVDACSFFKFNSFLLANTGESFDEKDRDNNIERRRCCCCGAKGVERLCREHRNNRWCTLSEKQLLPTKSHILRRPTSRIPRLITKSQKCTKN